MLSVTSNYINRFDRKSNNVFKNQCNTILISYFQAIAQIIEIILNNRFPTNNNAILWHTIREYLSKRPDQVTDDLKTLLENVTK